MREATLERTHRMGGVQKLYRFDNGYGASVVRSQYTYGGKEGLWELAVARYTGDGIDDWEIDYTTRH